MSEDEKATAKAEAKAKEQERVRALVEANKKNAAERSKAAREADDALAGGAK